ncbi:carboxypeptidase-like regulatory domain-containing protein [Fulvivirga sp. 29W222]|uniref:Carboxypeptidase-like regulatory domain-containing protein n=1 Tax=Fulvivirga marina TaxID=2494733 RepID=A0A937G2K8_9BACT|nr:carboxypeptidase-like regulatory domain-containing protein [Fulvivirga marina]MBL6448830.1 carboxypeptidase-like regulatory domain-containing protein [Fulvivirga marina]
MKFKLIFSLFVLLTPGLLAQTGEVNGIVKDGEGKPLMGVNIQKEGSSSGVFTDKSGGFKIGIEANEPAILLFTHVGYTPEKRTVTVKEGEVLQLHVILVETTEVLTGVQIEGERDNRDEVSITKIKPKSLESLPTAFGDFNKILSTLPGVVSNNELSSTYSVRGGSFDENLIYVNDIPVYRPFLISNGQQEGLSFVNSNLVESVEFSAGGWQPKYGDKLSSALNVDYKKPSAFGASLTLGLLGGMAHAEGASKSKKFTYVAGVRHKSAQYLLNTLETQGEYLPKFTDLQAYVSYKLDDKTSIGVLTSYARNRYFVQPQSRETEFGTFDRSFRLFVGFAGREILEYDTYQGGLKLTRKLSDRFKSELIASGVYALEREYTDVEGAYRLCDVDKNLGSDTFNECVYVRGIGSNYDYGRNNLEANIINLENRNVYSVDSKNTVEFGLGYSYQNIDDQLNEYTFRDSVDFVIDIESLQADNETSSQQYTGFVQHTSDLTKRVTTTYGVRLNYWTLNNQLLVSPRGQVSYRTDWVRDVVFKAAVGVYQQPAFYRELRGPDGVLNKDLKAQKSIHFIGGMDYNFKWWGRDFKFISELYYKRLRDVVAYDIDNVKVRYYANNNAKAYATGLDLRVSGEFIEGTESWFSLGLLNAREDVEGDGRGYIRRPTDQRLNVAVFFQDHLPNNPTFRVSLNLFFGSGLPFGPPQNFEKRNVFNGDTYRRLDIGFSKLFYLNRQKYDEERLLTLSAEILNVLAVSNAISYTWVTDVSNNQFAVPNTLSARFLNVKLSIKI